MTNFVKNSFKKVNIIKHFIEWKLKTKITLIKQSLYTTSIITFQPMIVSTKMLKKTTDYNN